MIRTTYAEGIRSAFRHLLSNYPECFAIGQGLWSPWYVGTSMQDLDEEFGVERIIDTPVSELATTGAALGASLFGYRPIVVHPRMDFMVLAMDQIVNQAAKWRHMLGGNPSPAVTIRAIINRGGEQGAQHSQALHAWFAHVPGIRVVMPATPADARDLLIASVLCNDPVVYIDDRWLYDWAEDVDDIEELELSAQGPKIVRDGRDVTIVAVGYSTRLACEVADVLAAEGIHCEVIDLRVINPLDVSVVCDSVRGTGRLITLDGGWRSCGLAGEIIASVMEALPLGVLRAPPIRVTLPDAPAPTSAPLEQAYYPSAERVASSVRLIAS